MFVSVSFRFRGFSYAASCFPKTCPAAPVDGATVVTPNVNVMCGLACHHSSEWVSRCYVESMLVGKSSPSVVLFPLSVPMSKLVQYATT